jgi:hypothetical protein
MAEKLQWRSWLGCEVGLLILRNYAVYSWYYWKLPAPTFWSHATAWGGYILHQVTLWGLIYWAQKQKLKYSDGLHRNLSAAG